jgi:spore coat polysaccharide biosynthesis protein SpsF (cytidylyltransferase family)
MKKGILIQARLSSSRFPGKMLKTLGGIPLVHYIFNRCKISSKADIVAIITSTESSDTPLYKYCQVCDIPIFRGSLTNVLDRYIQASNFFELDLIGRICGDSPFVDIDWIDRLFKCMEEEKKDYMAATGVFNGFFSEVVTLKSLLKILKFTNSRSDLEHVTKYIRNNLDKFGHRIFDMGLQFENYENITLTIDFEKDLILANTIIKNGLTGFNFTSQDVSKNLYIDNHDS